MPLGPHRVLAEFVHNGERIKPPLDWVPPTQEIAERLVKAGCLRPLPVKSAPAEIPAMPPPDAGAGDGSADAAMPQEDPPAMMDDESTPSAPTKRRRGRRGG